MAKGTCTRCGLERPILARGLCVSCYNRAFRAGQLGSYAPVRSMHGMTRLPEYGVWKAMHRRCSTPTNKRYSHYGGRGIAVCESWSDFAAFIADMGTRPSDDHTLERRDNDGDYCPENCVWATYTTQARNTSRNRWLEYRGERLTVAGWSERLRMRPTTIVSRLRMGWTVERTLSEPVRKRHQR